MWSVIHHILRIMIWITQRNLLKDNYETCKRGRSDYCYAFIEASMQELSTEEMQDYIKMDILLDELEKNMFESRE